MEEARPRTVLQATYGGDIGHDVGTPVAWGSTAGRTHELTPDCHDPAVPHSAPDVSYTWTPPYTDSFTITTDGSSFDTVLSVRTYAGGTLVGCNDNASSLTQQSSLTLSLTKGVAYVITVDGSGSSVGTFHLNIDSVSCPGACEPPQNGCYGPLSFCDISSRTCLFTYWGDTTTCDDNNACTTNDRCDGNGECASTPVVCDTPPGPGYYSTGTCSPSTGACSYTPLPAGTSCDDGNACTTNDEWNGAGSCGGTPAVCNTPPGPGYNSTGTCNPSTGVCGYAPLAAGTPCNDGQACTTNDVWNGAGSCGGTAKTCYTPPGPGYYSTGTCSPSTGACNYTPLPAGTPCDDLNACTLNDVWDGAGSCGGTPRICNSPPGQCYVSTGTCSNTSTGACSYAPKAAGASCSDGKSCTGNDTCDGAGSCRSGSLTCAPMACHARYCGETGDCEYVYLCDDVTTTCRNGTCRPILIPQDP